MPDDDGEEDEENKIQLPQLDASVLLQEHGTRCFAPSANPLKNKKKVRFAC